MKLTTFAKPMTVTKSCILPAARMIFTKIGDNFQVTLPYIPTDLATTTGLVIHEASNPGYQQ